MQAHNGNKAVITWTPIYCTLDKILFKKTEGKHNKRFKAHSVQYQSLYIVQLFD